MTAPTKVCNLLLDSGKRAMKAFLQAVELVVGGVLRAKVLVSCNEWSIMVATSFVFSFPRHDETKCSRM